MIEPLKTFLRTFEADVTLDETLVLEKKRKYYLLSGETRALVGEDFFYAGVYLGKLKEDRFFPSFGLLRIMTRGKANRIIVDEKTEWLFICGRDVFRRGILGVVGAPHEGDHVLVLNQYSECLGFGKFLGLGAKQGREVAVKNILDLGDFLRRER